jgi:hypothetical protein
LSANQVSILERIEAGNSSDLRQADRDFTKLWYSDSALREEARVVCKYYELTEYFRVLTYKILQQDYAPKMNEYKKLCKNKYAIRVLEEHKKQPRYPVNSLVQVRATNKINSHLRGPNYGYASLKDTYAIVIETDALPIRRAAKGAKIYKILPVGSPRPYYVHESDIKKARGVKK